MTFPWLKKLSRMLSRQPKPLTKPSRCKQTKLYVERLEDRWTPTTTLVGAAGAPLTITITGADTVNLSVNGAGQLVVNDTTANVVDSTSLFSGSATSTATETATLARDNFTAINVIGNGTAGQNLNFLGGSFTDANGPSVTANSNLPTVNFAGATSTFGGALNVRATTSILVTAGIANNNAVTLTSTGPLTITGGITLTGVGGLNLSAVTLTVSGPAINQGSGVLTTIVSGTGTIAAPITGVGGSLVVTGAGTLTLSGTDTYTASTTVSNGTLLVNGTLASDASPPAQETVTVNAGGTLGGIGTIQRSVNVAGTLTPGFAVPGVFTVANVTFVAGSTFTVTLNGPTVGTGYSQLVVTGTPVNLGSATLNLLGGFTPAGGSGVTLLSNRSGSPVTGTFHNLADGAAVTVGAFSGLLTYEGNAGSDVTLTASGAASFTGTGATVFTVRKAGVDLQLLENGVLTDSRPLAAITNYTLTGAPSVVNLLNIDVGTGGFFTLNGGLFFNGGASGSNTVQVTGGTLNGANLTYTNGTNGDGTLLGTSNTKLFFVFSNTQFADLTNNTISELSFNLPYTAAQVVLTDNGDGNVSGVASTNGTLFVPTVYKDPTGVLFWSSDSSSINVMRTAATQAAYFVDGASLVLNLSRTSANDLDFVTATAVDSATLGGPIYYQGGLTLALGSGNNIVSIQSTSSQVSTLVQTGNGNNTIYVSVPNPATDLETPLGIFLSVQGGTGKNQLTLNIAAQPVTNTYFVTNNAIAGNAIAGNVFTVFYTGNFSGGINVVGASGNNTFNVLSQSSTAPTTVYAGAGNSTFNVAVTTGSAYQLTVVGGTGTNTLGVFDTSGGATVTQQVISSVSGIIDVAYTGVTTSAITYNEVQQIGSNDTIH